jgi:hypothetical protein
VANTRFGLETVPTGQQPRVDHVCFNIADFDRKETPNRLKKLGVEVAPPNDEQLLRFRDPNGVVIELKPNV